MDDNQTVPMTEKPKPLFVQITPSLIALITVAGGLYIMGFGVDGKAAIVAPLVTFVLGYFFGTGVGSQAKDKTIARMLTPPDEECK